MKKNFFAFLAAVLMFSASAHAEVDAAAAEAFVKNVTRQGIEQIINANVSQAEKDARLPNFLTMLWIWTLSDNSFSAVTGEPLRRSSAKSSLRFIASLISAPGQNVLTNLKAKISFLTERRLLILKVRFL